MVIIDFDNGILVRRVFVELAKGDRLKIVLGIEDNRASAQPDHSGCPPATGMPNSAVGTTQMVRVIAGDRPLLDKQFAHRDHFPLDFLTFGAEIIEFTGSRIGIDFRYFKSAAVPPAHS